jgi:hypothetical protein
LAGKVSAEEMLEMNYAVDSEHRDVGVVVREFGGARGFEESGLANDEKHVCRY